MAIALTITDHWSDTKRIHVTGVLTPSGSYTTGGDPVPITSPLIKSASLPVYAHAYGASAVYDYLVTLSAGVPAVKVVTRSTGAELAAGAYPAGIISDLMGIYIIFPKFI